MSKSLKEITRKILSYCNIPAEITKNHWISEYNNGCYVEYEIISKEKAHKYEYYSPLDNWILTNYPELKGQKILIHIDY